MHACSVLYETADALVNVLSCTCFCECLAWASLRRRRFPPAAPTSVQLLPQVTRIGASDPWHSTTTLLREYLGGLRRRQLARLGEAQGRRGSAPYDSVRSARALRAAVCARRWRLPENPRIADNLLCSPEDFLALRAGGLNRSKRTRSAGQ